MRSLSLTMTLLLACSGCRSFGTDTGCSTCVSTGGEFASGQPCAPPCVAPQVPYCAPPPVQAPPPPAHHVTRVETQEEIVQQPVVPSQDVLLVPRTVLMPYVNAQPRGPMRLRIPGPQACQPGPTISRETRVVETPIQVQAPTCDATTVHQTNAPAVTADQLNYLASMVDRLCRKVDEIESKERMRCESAQQQSLQIPLEQNMQQSQQRATQQTPDQSTHQPKQPQQPQSSPKQKQIPSRESEQLPRPQRSSGSSAPVELIHKPAEAPAYNPVPPSLPFPLVPPQPK
jgi:hypothetical protein